MTLGDDGETKIFRYEDDFFFILSEAAEVCLRDAVSEILLVLGAYANGLTLTFETPTGWKFQFLNTRFSFLEDRIC